MADIATLGIAIDTTDVTRGAAELDKLTAAGQRAQARADAMGDSIRKQNAAMVQTTSATAANAQAIDRSSTSLQKLDAELERFLAANNKAYAAQRTFQQGQDLLTRSVEAGVVSQQTASQYLADLQKRIDATGESAVKGSVSASFLTREIRALGDEAASGRWRQFDGTLAGLGSRMLALGPVGLVAGAAVAGVAAAVALVIAKQEEMQRAIQAIEVGFASTGNAAILGGTQIRGYIETLARLPGVSNDAAEKSITELSRVPYITGPLFDGVTKHLGDLAAMFGTTVPVAAAKLAQAFADPARGGAELDKQFNLLTTDQRLLFEAYIEHGNRASALALVMQALEDRSQGLADKLATPLTKSVNDVGNAWNDLMKSFSNESGTNSAANGIANLLERTAALMKFVRDHMPDWQGFLSIAGKIPQTSLLANSVSALMSPTKPQAPGGNSVSGTLQVGTYHASDNYGSASLADFARAGSDSSGGQSESERQLNEQTASYQSRAAANKILLQQEAGIKDLIAQETATIKSATASDEERATATAARERNLDKIVAIQERLAKGTKVEPLGLNVDHSAMETGMKAVQVQQDDLKSSLAEGQKLRDFYHKLGITSDADYNKATDAANNDYLAQEQRFYEQQIALVTADEAKLKSLKPANKQQADQIQTAVNEDEKKRIDLLAKEDALTKQIAADNAFRQETAPYLKAQEDFNRALKETQEIQASVSEAEQRANLEAQLGLKSQSEGIATVTAARQVAIEKLQEELAKLQAIHAQTPQYTTDGTTMTQAYIDQAKAIDQVNVKLLQMQAALDPIGQKLNQTFNSDLTNFFDKFASGGIKSFKDLKSAALDFGKSLWTSVAHEANQKLSDSILKSLGNAANDATGTTGGLGGMISSWLGLGPASSTTATASATAALTALTDAAYAAAGALSGTSVTGGGGGGAGGIFGGFAGLFGGGGGSANTTTALASDDAVMSNPTYFSDMGVTPYLHGGGIVGRDYAFTRHVAFTRADVDAAPRFHQGGVAGLAGYEQLSVLQKGEEVLTANDPRHRNNGGGRSGRQVSVTNHFTVQPTASRASQAQIAAATGAAVNSTLARNR